jgi:hypothetical protein
MRALCGAIIAAGALIGLGLATVGIGTRYQNWNERDRTSQGLEPLYVKFTQMDSSLIFVLVLLVAALVIGLGIAFVGLALHHERRRREHEHNLAMAKTQHRVSV